MIKIHILLIIIVILFFIFALGFVNYFITKATLQKDIKEIKENQNKIVEKRNVEEKNFAKFSKYVNWIVQVSGIEQGVAEYILTQILLNSDYPDLMLALIDTESNFNSQAVSVASARGLCQVMFDVWKDDEQIKAWVTKPNELFDIDKNIKCGNYILVKYYNEGKSWKKALTMYSGNATDYYDKVMTRYAELTFYMNYGEEK